MPRWIIIVDLRKCNGCESCVSVCHYGHNLSHDMTWRRVAQAPVQDDPLRQRVFLPVSCMHCANPPCLDVCPTGATFQHEDSVVDIHAERCMGCGYCVLACPYLARTIAPSGKAEAVLTRPGSEEWAGLCTKCDLCHSKVQEGIASGLVPGRDAGATPMCVVSCLPGAIHFGDSEDPASGVSKLLRENKTSRIHDDLGTEPSLYYILP